MTQLDLFSNTTLEEGGSSTNVEGIKKSPVVTGLRNLWREEKGTSTFYSSSGGGVKSIWKSGGPTSSRGLMIPLFSNSYKPPDMTSFIIEA